LIFYAISESFEVRIPEQYIHYAWQYGLYRHADLQTTEGLSIEVIHPGRLNAYSGPDFSDSRVLIGGQEWAGNIEIHFRSSDWYAHNHETDSAYDSVVLHVVVEHDKPVTRPDGEELMTLELSSFLDSDHFAHYNSLMAKRSWVACADSVSSIDEFYWTGLKERKAIERLESKSQSILQSLEECLGDWDTVIYRLLAKALGGKVNTLPFEQLCMITPLKVIRKHCDDPHVLEALMLGQAGFLVTYETLDEYGRSLHQEYTHLAHKYDLKCMDPVAWKHGGIRPASAPQIRIAQFARFWSGKGLSHSFILTAELKALHQSIDIELEGYWRDHIGLGKPSTPRVKRIGSDLIGRILINVVAYIRAAYGIRMRESSYMDSALSLLESLAPESNAIIRKWKSLGVKAQDARDSQALLQLKSDDCDKKRCLSCVIGRQVLKNNE